MNIGQAAKASGVSAKMIRYYESIGLVKEANRTAAGYRLYSDVDVETLRFIHRARTFGFSIERIRLLVGLWQERRPSREVKRIALQHVAELQAMIEGIAAMRSALEELVTACHGDQRPDCPILREFERSEPTASPVVPEKLSPATTEVPGHRRRAVSFSNSLRCTLLDQ